MVSSLFFILFVGSFTIKLFIDNSIFLSKILNSFYYVTFTYICLKVS